MSDFLSTSRHPEFISGYHFADIILKQVQHDVFELLNQVLHDEGDKS